MKRAILLVALVVRCLAGEPNLNAPIAAITLTDGRTLRNVVLVSYSPTVVMAKWEGGRGTLTYDLFPSDYQTALERLRPAPLPAPQPTTSEPRRVESTKSERPGTPSFPPFDDSEIVAIPFQEGPQSTTAGQCFIATRGGQNFKLGLVEVRIYPEAAFNRYRLDLRARTTARFEAMNAYGSPKNFAALPLDDMQRRLAIVTKLFEEKHRCWAILPPAPASTQTDADGRFTITHKVAAPYVVFARAKRAVAGDDEYYVWALHSDKIANPAQVFLSNDNYTLTP